jgi:hypothetical protein
MSDRGKGTKGPGKPAKPVARKGAEPEVHHSIAETNRPDSPELEGGTPLPEEVTGRASKTRENLMTLFDNDSPEHLADGFRGGSEEE